MKPDEILRQLGQAFPIRCFDTIDSTNAHAKRWALEGAPQGAMVLAETQTQGRGRRGREFMSPPGGLYMSLIVDYTGGQPGHLTTLAAVAALEAARDVSGHSLQIKWVNDLMCEGLKVGGILTEGIILEGRMAKAVIGIGINLGTAAPPVPGAGSLGRTSQAYPREELAAGIAGRILAGLPHLPRHLEAYRAHCLTLGQTIRFEYKNQPMTGLAKEIDDEGALIVETASGLIRLLGGDVSVRPFSGQNA